MQVETNKYINAMQEGIDLSGPKKILPFGHGALTEYRADMPERCYVSGYKEHQGGKPCMKCNVSQRELHTNYHLWGHGTCTPDLQIEQYALSAD